MTTASFEVNRAEAEEIRSALEEALMEEHDAHERATACGLVTSAMSVGRSITVLTDLHAKVEAIISILDEASS